MTFGKIEGVDSIVLTFNAPHFMGCMVLITKSAIVTYLRISVDVNAKEKGGKTNETIYSFDPLGNYDVFSIEPSICGIY